MKDAIVVAERMDAGGSTRMESSGSEMRKPTRSKPGPKSSKKEDDNRKEEVDVDSVKSLSLSSGSIRTHRSEESLSLSSGAEIAFLSGTAPRRKRLFFPKQLGNGEEKRR